MIDVNAASEKTRTISPALVLFIVFLVALLGLTLLMTGNYRNVEEAYSTTGQARVSGSVLTTAVRSHDAVDAVSVERGEQGTVLVLTSQEQTGRYDTRYYLAGGYLVEDFAPVGAPLSPEGATKLVAAKSFDVRVASPTLLHVTIDSNQTMVSLQAGAVRDARGEGAV